MWDWKKNFISPEGILGSLKGIIEIENEINNILFNNPDLKTRYTELVEKNTDIKIILNTLREIIKRKKEIERNWKKLMEEWMQEI